VTGETIVFGFCAGVSATVTMDVFASASRRLGLAAGAKGQWVGRWYLGIARGHFVHSNIAVAPEQTGEKRAALVGHYAIGIALAVLYVAGAGWLGVSPDVFLVALGYGFATSSPGPAGWASRRMYSSSRSATGSPPASFPGSWCSLHWASGCSV